MKTYRLTLILIGLSLALTASAANKDKKLTLEDVIFDSKYLAEFLGPKTLLQFEGDAAPILVELSKTDLVNKTTFMQLPTQAVAAKPKYETPPYYPESKKRMGEAGEARYLIFVGADGKV